MRLNGKSRFTLRRTNMSGKPLLFPAAIAVLAWTGLANAIEIPNPGFEGENTTWAISDTGADAGFSPVLTDTLPAGAGAMVQAADPILVWSDEFDADGLPDGSKWMYDVGGDGWGNNEEQFYTEARLENARVESGVRVERGVLIIEAHKEQWLANPVFQSYNDYTSARLVSKGSGDWLYGRIEVRAKLPAGRGTWPAIWMLPTGNAYGRWPRSGEIDIMEHVGFDMGQVHGSLHSLAHNWTTGTQPTGSTVLADVDTAFHDYAIEWSPD